MIEFINHIFEVNNEISVPIVISIIIFLTGGFSKFMYDFISNYKNKRDDRKNYIILIEEVIKELQKRIDDLSHYRKKLIDPNFDGDYLKYSNLSSLNTFSLIDFNSLVKTFSNDKITVLRLYSLCINLQKGEDNVHNNLIEKFGDSNNYKELYFDSINVFIENYDKFFIKNEKNINVFDYHKKTSILLNNFKNDITNKMFINSIQNEIIDPIYNITIEFPQNIECIEIFDNLNEIRKYYRKIQYSKTNLKFILSHYNKVYNKALKEIEISLSNLK